MRAGCHASFPLTWAAAAVGCRRTSVGGHGRVPRLCCLRVCRCCIRWLDSAVLLPVGLRSSRPEEAEERREPRPQRTLQRNYIMCTASRCTPNVTCLPCWQLRATAAYRQVARPVHACELADHEAQAAHQ